MVKVMGVIMVHSLKALAFTIPKRSELKECSVFATANVSRFGQAVKALGW